MITLIIVECQNDFISGTMIVKDARQMVENIKEFIRNNRKIIDKIIFVVDWHPYNHCSFKQYGGEYPRHCIQYTPGACIEPKLLKLVQSYEIDYEVSRKGEIEEVEEFGAFNEIEFSSDELGQRYYFDSIVVADANTEFVICGIKDNVLSTIKNMQKEGIIPKIFKKGIIPENIEDFVKEYQIKEYESENKKNSSEKK